MSDLHQHTPSLSVVDPRGLAVRSIAFHRRDVGEAIAERGQRQVFNARGQLAQQWDPRLLELSEIEAGVQPNQSTFYSLSGQVLLTESVDAGWRLACHDAVGLLRDSWDGRDTHRRFTYDERMRPVNVFEHEPPLCVERFTYAGADDENARHNRCGQLLRHDDQAGSVWHETFGLTGQPLTEARQFCTSLAPPQWPESEADLEDKTYITCWRHDALGAVIEQTDALGHVQRFEADVAGQPFASWLDGGALLKNTTYNAFGHVELEQSGNEVITTAYYSARDGLLSNLKATRPDGKILQDLHYQYDPVGNITRIEDLAQPVQWFAGQRIQAVSTYTYDTLYQLTRASGRENASQIIGPSLPELEVFGPVDDSRWRNYSQTYAYDSGGNLTQLKHDAGAGNVYTREMLVDPRSNRSLFKDGSPIDFAKGFDANGNQQALAPGQHMQWDTRNQLRQVTQVQRDEPQGQDDDNETYVYEGSGQRVRKVRRAKTRGGEQVSEVRYLPGLEIRSRTTGEQLHVVIAQAGRNGVRLLHWEDGRRKGIDNDQLRYSLSDHLGSSTLELDQTAELLSQESYYPYGGTAWWAAKNAIEANYKVIRYSGKERDATGLYYYGFRYYAPWLQRWMSPDPAGDVDGLNVFRMVRNNPVTLMDTNGLAPEHANRLTIHMFYYGDVPQALRDNMINTIKTSPDNKVNLWVDARARNSFHTLSGELGNLELKDWEELKNVVPIGGGDDFKYVNDIFSAVEGSAKKGKEKSLSDLSRLVALYKYGGLYLDADVVVSEGFSKDELFGESDFRTHISFEDSTFNVDYYDALGFKEPHDSDLRAALNELSVDYNDGYLEAASTPGELVKIKSLVRSKLNKLLSEDEVIDDVLSEDRMSADSLKHAESAVAKINISTTLSKKIRSLPMGNA